jgi:hypothetical protein
LPGKVVDGTGVSAGGGCQAAVADRGPGEAGQPAAQEPVVQAGEEQGLRDAGAGDLVAEGVRDALDEPVLAQAPEVVSHLPRGNGLGGDAEESFWVAQASGNHPTLTWTVTDGSYRVVVMNADAAAPVAFSAGLALTIPHLFAIGLGLLIGGIVLIVIAVALIVLGARTRPQPRPVPDLAARA